MPHRPGHGTQRRRIERQSRGQTATPISKGAQQAANTALVNAEINRLNRFVEQNQDLKNQISASEIIQDMPDKFKNKFLDKESNYYKDDGKTLTEQGKYILGYYNDGRNDYQRQLNRFIKSSPESAQAYAKRFPLENFLQKAAPVAVGIMTGLPLGAGTIYDQSRKLGSATISGLKKFAQDKGIIPKDDINPDTGTTAVKTDALSPMAQSRVDEQNIFTGQTPTDPQPIDFPSQFTGATPTGPELPFRFEGPLVVNPDDMMIPEARRPVEDVLPTDPITEGLKTLFTGATPRDPRPVREQFSSTFQQPFNPPMIPGGIPRGSLPVREGRLLGQDPNVAYGQELSLLDIIADNLNTRGFQEGGLASINNPQYNMLMKASDFDI